MSSAAKVGVFVLIVLGILGFFILKIEKIRIGGAGERKTIEVRFDDVAGLNEKSLVLVAGVKVGTVKTIILDKQGHAIVTLELEQDVPIHQGASAKVASLGLLGEKHVELDPGDPTAPEIDPDLSLPGVASPTIDQVTAQVSAIATDVKAITESLRGAIGGPAGEKRIEDIVVNVQDITARVRALIAANEASVSVTAENFRKITDDLRVEIPRIAESIERFVDSMGGTVGENREDLREITKNLRGLSGDLRTTADNLNAITGQVKSGEGSVGKLIYSDEAHDRLTNALSSVEGGVTELKNTLGRVGKIALDLGIKSDYYAGLDLEPDEGFDGNSRTAVTLSLIPNPEINRFYNVELSDDPRGRKRTKIIQTTVTDDAGNESTTTTREVRFDRDFLISAQAGWKFDRVGVRIGLFDSVGGVGADYSLNNRLSVTGEAFDFGKKRDDNPHLRLFGRYVFRREKPTAPALFLSTGIDNPLNDTSFTIGGGIRWRDEDLKYLLGSIPIK
ncbi:MAG TPA: MlaD family protein [Thermoanaerobaculia bacterium]